MSYIGNQPVLQSTEFREEFFPTSNQSAFTTGGFHPSAVSVTRNGVLLSESDYTKGSDNVTITLANAAVSGDVVVIRGNRSLAQGVSVSESRVEYTWQSGDTVVQLNADVIPAYTDVYVNGIKLWYGDGSGDGTNSDYSINAALKQVSFFADPAVGDVIAVVHRNETSALVGLPLKDSSGAAILSESAGSVVLANVDTATIGSNALVVDSSGNVGIGTSSPTGKLDVGGDIKTSGEYVINSGTTAKWTLGESSDSLYFYSVAAGTERMRIDSSGNLLVGTTSTLNSNKFLVTSTNFVAGFNVTNGTGEAVRFYSNGTGVGTISVTGSSTSYFTSSDYRLKENITEITDGIARVKQLNPSRFNFIADPDNTVDGFIAHEIQGIVPEAVSGEKDAVNEDGSIRPQGIDQSKLVPLLTAALQESIALIESQQSQIDALTARIEALEATP